VVRTDITGHDRDNRCAVTLTGQAWASCFTTAQGKPLAPKTQSAAGTEMMLSRGLPPALGNVCVGIWKQLGPRTFKLKHMAWNWDANGNFVSVFVMDVTLRIDRHGTKYTCTYSANNLTLSGTPIAGEHFEGNVRGTKITVD